MSFQSFDDPAAGGDHAARLADLRGRTDAVGLVALDHPQVREAINALAASGVRIGTLVSDIPPVDKVG